MTTAYDVDFFVIGAGSGGVRSARIAALHGARVAIAEEYRIGGTCVIRGCVPKKLLVYASRFADSFEDAAGFGWTVEGASFSWPVLIANKDRDIERISEVYERNLRVAKVAIHKARATIEEPHVVRLSTGERITAEKVVVATGGWPVKPDIPGIDLAITSNEMFDLEDLPKSIAIVGGGYIGLEFASLMQRLGAQVTLIHRSEKLLRGFDDDMRDGAAEALERAGVRLRLCSQIAAIARTGAGGLRATYKEGGEDEFEQIMFASGRAPNVRGLGLEELGVLFDQHGAIRVDGFSQTTVPWIYAIGDVTNRLNLTPVAIREGHALADMLFGGKSSMVDLTNVPTAVFITPEIGTVGLTEEQARCRCATVDIYKTSFRPLKATLSGRQDRVLMKLVVDGTTDRVLGVHILGEDAAEMIQLAAIAVKLGATKADFDATVALHPTIAEEIVTMRVKWMPPAEPQEEPAAVPAAIEGETAIPELVAQTRDEIPDEVVAEILAEATEPALQRAVELVEAVEDEVTK